MREEEEKSELVRGEANGEIFMRDSRTEDWRQRVTHSAAPD